MNDDKLNKKIVVATKWSIITELVSKFITPITSIILARILAPEAFGVLATVQMIIAFANVFVESGFQKYLIQHKFTSYEEEERYMSVAFWGNLAVSLAIWLLISCFSEYIACMVGNSGKGFLITITGVTIPLYAMIGIQSCKLIKDLEFDKLFYVRVVTALVPLFITVPLALLGYDYWSLIIGNIAGISIQMITLIVVGTFRPRLYFSLIEIKEMFSYGMWTTLNGVAVWLTVWIDSFLVGYFLTDYFLGLYRNSTSMVVSIFTIVTAAIVPVLFSSLSKYQDDDEKFKKIYLNVYRVLCMILLPLGVGLGLYRNFVTNILLGSQWIEASNIVGITAVTIVLRTIYVSMNSDVFRAKGKFNIPLYMQIVDIFLTVPLCYFSLKADFWTFVYVRAISRLILIFPQIYYMKKVCNIGLYEYINTGKVYYLATLGMMSVAFIMNIACLEIHDLIKIIICASSYFAFLFSIKKERVYIVNMIRILLPKTI